MLSEPHDSRLFPSTTGSKLLTEEIQEECGGNDQALKLVSADYIAFLVLCTLKTS